MSQTKVLGEYYFRRTEMASGFNFSADGKFQFFFTYGAVDRNATGTFSIEGNTLKLKSDKEAGKDFTITNQSKQANGYTLEFTHPNKYLTKNILCIFISGGKSRKPGRIVMEKYMLIFRIVIPFMYSTLYIPILSPW